jgi:hypothetical protein
MELSLPIVGDSMKRLSDWLWSMKGPRAAARSIRARWGSSHAVRFEALDRAFSLFDAADHLVVPEAQCLQLGDEVAVDLKELTGHGFPLEQVRDLRFDAFVAAGDGGDGGRRGDRH